MMDGLTLLFFFAEEAGHDADGHGGGLLSDTYFWVGFGFLLFLGLIGRKAWAAIAAGLDARADKIAGQIEEARLLREDAQKRLAEAERRNRDAEKEAAFIQQQAEESAAALLQKAEQEADALIARRNAQADVRIAQLEAQAVAHVREVAAHAATVAARQVLAEAMGGEAGQSVLNSAIDEVGQRLN